MKYILFIFFLIVLSVVVVAGPCDFAWNTATLTSQRCPGGAAKQNGGITSLQYAAASHSFNLLIDPPNDANLGSAPQLIVSKRAYYTVKDVANVDNSCTGPVGTTTIYWWCPLDLSIGAGMTPYTFSNPSANNKWFNARAGGSTIAMTAVPVDSTPTDTAVRDFYLDKDGFIAVFMCGCTGQGCMYQSNWECNPVTAGLKGVSNGRWILMPFNRCLEGEKRLVPDPNPPGDYTQAYECKNGQWQQYVCNGSPC